MNKNRFQGFRGFKVSSVKVSLFQSCKLTAFVGIASLPPWSTDRLRSIYFEHKCY